MWEVIHFPYGESPIVLSVFASVARAAEQLVLLNTQNPQNRYQIRLEGQVRVKWQQETRELESKKKGVRLRR